jgi:glycosyltransferase involved in cell wall biosynthesis
MLDGIPVTRIHRSDPYNDRWDKSFCPTAGAFFDKILAATKPQLLHVHHWMRLSRDLVELARRRKIPAVVTLHDLWTTCHRLDRVLDDESFCDRKLDPQWCVPCVGGARPWTGPGELKQASLLFREDVKNELRLARRRIVPTKSHGARIAAALDLEPESFLAIPNGSITELPRAKRRKPMDDGFLRIGHWGALYSTKGIHILLEAVRAMKHRDKVEVQLYGGTSDDKYGERIQQLADGLRVKFMGMFRTGDLERAVFDVVVLPSLAAESYSFALDEALAIGFPIVASDFGALGERLGAAGRVFPRGDRAALAAILDGFVENPSALEAIRPVEAPATIGAHAERLELLYSEAIAEGAPKASAFDDRAHATFEFQRSENRLRHALRYESLAKYARDIQDDRENRIKMIEFLQADRERLEKQNSELLRRVAAAEREAAAERDAAVRNAAAPERHKS